MEPMEQNPSDPVLVARVGHALFDWAADLYDHGQKEAAVPVFGNAIAFYDRVLEITPGDPVVLGDRAFALYYMGSDDAVEALETFVAAAMDRADLAVQVETAERLIGDLC